MNAQLDRRIAQQHNAKNTKLHMNSFWSDSPKAPAQSTRRRPTSKLEMREPWAGARRNCCRMGPG